MIVRTRFAPSPTGFAHIGSLKASLVEYLIAKSNGGKFILRIEDTDQKRYVEGSVEAIYSFMEKVGLKHDEGPDIGGPYGPYVQSERREIYMEYAKKLVDTGHAYYCFCSKDRLETLKIEDVDDDVDAKKYDRLCYRLAKNEVDEKIKSGAPFVIRQLIPEGTTAFFDEVFGEITVENAELDDQILIKSDGLPTYNFANVVDDHLMEISHVVRGAEYLSSTPKYKLLYEAFGWDVPKYVHTILILNEDGKKFSKRKGDASIDGFFAQGFLPGALVNYIALLGWSPPDNREIFPLSELCEIFDISGLSKAPCNFDRVKLEWFNGEYIKMIPPEEYFALAEPYLRETVTRPGVDLRKIAEMTRSRVNFIKDCAALVDFIDALPEYDVQLYEHKKMKTDARSSLAALESLVPFIQNISESDWNNDHLYAALCGFAEGNGLKNGQVLWPIRTALSGKPATPCGASELMELFGKDETLSRIGTGIELLKRAVNG